MLIGIIEFGELYKIEVRIGNFSCSVDLISEEVVKEVGKIVDIIVEGIIVKFGKVVGIINNSLHFLLSPSEYGAVLQETQ